MSGFIHIAEKTPVWRHVLRGMFAIVALATFGGYLLGDEGLPMASVPPGETIVQQPATLPAPPLHGRAEPVRSADEDERDTGLASVPGRALDPEPPPADDYAARNAGIDPRRLSATRPMAARSFLSEVLLAPGAGAALVVSEVLPESRFARMGLAPGDVIYTLDTPKMALVDESSMVALMQQTELELEVYRKGTLLRLHTSLNDGSENGDAAPR
jgi:hypothetical protein